MVRSKLIGSILGGALALGLLGGGAVAFAQSATPAAPSTQTAPSTEVAPATGLSDRSGWSEDDQALADALGITLEELQAAEETARIAMIDKAVADGRLTAEEGEALKTAGDRFHGGMFGYDKNEFLADALGISLEALQTAKLDVYEQALAARVAAGELTQEQADLSLAQKAAQYYLDSDALNAQVRSAYETAIAAAVADGAITQAQADALLAQLPAQTWNFGFGGHGGHGGHGGPGGHGGFRGDSLTVPETTPGTTTPDTTTDTSFGA